MITDVSSFDEAGAQLVRLDAHFQTDYRARRARLHHVLPSPRMRVRKGMWRSVAAGEGRGSASRSFRAQLAQRFGKISARKPRYPTTRASFLCSIAGCFSVAGRIPRSTHRPIRGRRTARAFPVGYLGFCAEICLWSFVFSRVGAIGDQTILDTLTLKAILAIIAKGQVGARWERASPKLTRSSQRQTLIHLSLPGPIKDRAEDNP